MIHDLIQTIADSAPLAPLREGLACGERRVQITGVRGTGKSLAVAAVLMARRAAGPCTQVIMAPSQERAETLAADLTAALGKNHPLAPMICPSLEALLYEETSPDVRLVRDRMSVLARLAMGEPLVLVLTPDAALHRTLPPDALRAMVRVVRRGEEIEPNVLAGWLASAGYAREGLAEEPGQFSLRGGVLDVFPSTGEYPVRLEFFGDEIDSLRAYDPVTQRSTVNADSVTLFPAREVLLLPERVTAATPAIRAVLQDRLGRISSAPIRVAGEGGKSEELLSPAERLSGKVEHELALLDQGAFFTGVEYYLPFLYPEGATLLDYLPADTAVILDEPLHIAEAFEKFQAGLVTLEDSRLSRGSLLPTPHALYLPLEEGRAKLAAYPTVELGLLTLTPQPPLPEERGSEGVDAAMTIPLSSGRGDGGVRVDLLTLSPTNYAIQPTQLETDLQTWTREGYAVVVATHQEHRIAERLAGLGVPVRSGAEASPTDGPAPGGVILVRRVELGEGAVLPDAKVAVLTDGELLGWQKLRRSVARRQAPPGQVLASVQQLEPGDYVVHINHGIGRYIGLVAREVQGVTREFLQVDYAGQDKLFVPIDQLDRVQKYMSLSDDAPSVHRLGGAEWERIKRKTKKSTEDLAKQLLQLQAIRSRQQGHAFSPDTPWQREMEEGFPWTETVDQLTAIQDVKHDMEAQQPMDRLVCGDVGYGKTEVAIRAAFKAVMDGKQVAILAPTTVLAAQHYRNFRERCAAFPIRVEVLSRAVHGRQQTKIVADVAMGSVDMLIGTHRILSRDIAFKNLGLVIIDEEQRFGVKQKEKLKSMVPGVDIITMSATPIPRTLHMALSGLREMSLINTPPEGRMPVRTLAMEADDHVLREAVLRELDRDGQVFVLHNRISSIYHVAERIKRIVPQASVEVAHGQMPDGHLDDVMMDFYERKFDVLVCTAIIENGVDFPNVNTIVVDQAEMFGLAQLYQLRGRVGRSDRQAYAYLTWQPRRRLTEMAQQRIGAMKEFAALGSGYRVALRDLEIRGAGDLLGADQSGVLAAVGYDMYTQMLHDAVAMVKGEYRETPRDVQIDLPMDAYLPTEYVPELEQRIDLYRRLAAVRKWALAEDLRAEMLDRYGKPLPQSVENLFRMVGIKLMCVETGVIHIGTERDAVVMRLDPERSLSPQAQKRLTFEAAGWRAKGLPAPAYQPERVTIFTMNVDQPTVLTMLEQVCDRLRTIESEVAKGPKTIVKLADLNRRRDADWRPFGR